MIPALELKRPEKTIENMGKSANKQYKARIQENFNQFIRKEKF